VLYLDCGTEDESMEENHEMSALLDSLNVPHVFHAYPGSHTWRYWSSHLHESLIAVTREMDPAGDAIEPREARR
jgi:enterochelin esterase-like enzyme